MLCETPSGTPYHFTTDELMDNLCEEVWKRAPTQTQFKGVQRSDEEVPHPDLGDKEFRRFTLNGMHITDEKKWHITGDKLERRDFMKEENVDSVEVDPPDSSSQQEKMRIHYILNR